MTDTKYPACECTPKRYTYFRRRNRNGTLHLLRKCRACHKIARNAMRASDYPTEWVNALEIVETDDTGQRRAIVQNANPVQTEKPMRRANPVQSRADAIQAKLQRHIQRRNTRAEA